MSSRDLEKRLVALLAQAATTSFIEDEPDCPQAGVDRDFDLLAGALASGRPGRTLRLWTNKNCVVVPRRLERHGDIATIRRRSAERGWPLVVRGSGGSAVLHRPGILCVSLINIFDVAEESPSGIYDDLIETIIDRISIIGLSISSGPVPGSYCDGAYNLHFNGQKIGGTAAHVKRINGRKGTLTHAYITVWGDTREDLAVIRWIENELDASASYREDAHTTLLDALHRSSAGHTDPDALASRGAGVAR